MKNITKNMLLISFVVFSYISAAIADEVELLSSFNITMTKYGQTWYTENYTVAVDNLSPEKSVYIHREMSDGSWIDIPLSYATTAGGEKEIWRGGKVFQKEKVGDEFIVAMNAHDTFYFDNNNENNYYLQDSGFLLGKDKKVAVHSANLSPVDLATNTQRLFAWIVVENLAPIKQVELIYTQDSWQTTKTIQAQHDGNPAFYGYGSYANPNSHNAESWSISENIPASVNGEYYIKYSIGDIIYYENNFGANYPLNTSYKN